MLAQTAGIGYAKEQFAPTVAAAARLRLHPSRTGAWARPDREGGTGVVRLENVALRYGRGPEVLQDVNLELEAGAFHFLTGASGAGKSTLLRVLYLAERPTRGRVWMFGQDAAGVARADLPALRRQIGVVFQDFRLLDHLSALDNVALPLRVAGIDEAVIKEHVVDLLRWVGLEDYLDVRPSRLSGGQQQRVAIARAIINRPSLLLADEPTGNVDDLIGLRLLYLFEELNRLGTTIVIATHNAALIERFGYSTILLRDGRVTMRPGTARKL
jgi:cell division transport system ATP-binding protein